MLGRRNAQFLAMRLRPARQSRYTQMGGPDVTRDRSGRRRVRAPQVGPGGGWQTYLAV